MSDAFQRKIRSVYNAIDSHNYKSALRILSTLNTCNGKKKKHTETPLLVFALLAITHDRLGQFEQAETYCLKVENARPHDLDVLYTMNVLYKSMRRMDRNANLYESAVERLGFDQCSEDLLVGLYFAYLRAGSSKKMQQTALKLFAQFSKLKYLVWACLCLYIQSWDVEESKGIRLVQLACSLLEREWEKGGHRFDSEMKVLLVKLRNKLNKFEESIDVLDHCGDLNLLDQKDLTIETLSKSEKYEKLVQFCTTFLKNDPEDYKVLQEYITASERIGKLHECVQSIDKMLQSRPQSQSLNLARIQLDPSLNAITAYFKRFGGKPCFFGDIRPFLEETGPHLYDEISRLSLETDLHTVSLTQLGDFYNRTDPLESISSLFNAFVSSENALNTLESTENGPLDHALVHAIQISLLQHLQTHSLPFLYLALSLSAYGVQKRPSNASFKFLLVRTLLNPSIGCFDMALDVFKSMDIKEVQMESLSFVVMDDSVRYSHRSGFQIISALIEHFHSDVVENGPEMTVLAYKEGHWGQVTEFTVFHEKMRKSLHWRYSRCLKWFFMWEEGLDGLSAESDVDSLYGNYDLHVIANSTNDKQLERVINESVPLVLEDGVWDEYEYSDKVKLGLKVMEAVCRCLMSFRKDQDPASLRFINVLQESGVLNAFDEQCVLKRVWETVVAVLQSLDRIANCFTDETLLSHLSTVFQSVEVIVGKVVHEIKSLPLEMSLQLSQAIRFINIFHTFLSVVVMEFISICRTRFLPLKKDVAKFVRQSNYTENSKSILLEAISALDQLSSTFQSGLAGIYIRLRDFLRESEVDVLELPQQNFIDRLNDSEFTERLREQLKTSLFASVEGIIDRIRPHLSTDIDK